MPDTARADVLITPSRAYYRFATADTCEEGDLPCPTSGTLFDEITNALNDNNGDLMPTDVKHSVTIDYGSTVQEYNNTRISLKSYNFIISRISQLGDEFAFIRGFN